MAPRPTAVPIAARPATPAPAMKTLAGGTLPAAVTWPLKKRPKALGLDDRTVAADARHGGERVHLLRAREHARQRIDGEHRHLLRCEALHQLRVLRRPDEAHQSLARVHQ